MVVAILSPPNAGENNRVPWTADGKKFLTFILSIHPSKDVS